MQNNTRILISIDQKWRDLPGHVLIGLSLKNKDFCVYYCRAGNEKYYVDYFMPDILIINHVRSRDNEKLSLDLHKRGIQVFVLPTEGIPPLEKYRKIALGGTNNLNGVSRIFSWSNLTKKIFKRNHKNVIIGVPRFDFYHKKFNKVRLSKEEFCKKYELIPKNPIILIATNFTKASFYKKNQHFFHKDSINQKYNQFFKDNYQGIERISKIDYESRLLLVNFLKNSINKNVDRNYVLKLHPSEDHLFYEKELKNYNVKFITNEYIWNIIPHVDVEINRSCTTSFESWIMRKPTIEFRLNPHEYYISEDHSLGSYIATTFEDLEKSVDRALVNPKSFLKPYDRKRSEVLDRLLGKVDGKRTEFLVSKMIDSINISKSRNGYKRINWIVGFLLQFKDHLFHDIKVYGLYNFITGRRIDKLGRFDKYYHKSDIVYWEKMLKELLN